MNTYNTPNYDKALEKSGWKKFENHPVYYKQYKDDQYIVRFNTVFDAYQKLEEDWLNQGKLNKQEFFNRIAKLFSITSASNIIKNSVFDRKVLLMLTADFYFHNMDTNMHNKVREEYEQLSGYKY